MIECGGLPGSVRVTRETLMGELSRNVIRRGGCREVLLVTTVAVRRKSLELTVGMTRRTSGRSMCTKQRECRYRVIECGRFPGNIRMTRETIMRELGRNMVRRCHTVEIGLMTTETCR